MIIPISAYIDYSPNCFVYFAVYISYSSNCFVFYISLYNFIPATPLKANPLRRCAICSKNGIRKESPLLVLDLTKCHFMWYLALKNTILKSTELLKFFFMNFIIFLAIFKFIMTIPFTTMNVTHYNNVHFLSNKNIIHHFHILFS